jgi:hypothetical protein
MVSFGLEKHKELKCYNENCRHLVHLVAMPSLGDAPVSHISQPHCHLRGVVTSALDREQIQPWEPGKAKPMAAARKRRRGGKGDAEENKCLDVLERCGDLGNPSCANREDNKASKTKRVTADPS